jgi:hypothetical protein
MRPASRSRKPRRQPRAEANPHVQTAILEAVQNQLCDESFPEVQVTLQRLLDSGLSEREARLYIGMALLFEMNEILRTKAPFNRARYVASLNRLPQL